MENVSLTAGFADDPYVLSLFVGGASNQASSQFPGSSCAGLVPASPQYSLDYTAGTYNLYISAVSPADTTLVVRAPDGTVHCNDDSDGTLNPSVGISNPSSGRYLIWLGTYSETTSTDPARVVISEIGGLRALGVLDDETEESQEAHTSDRGIELTSGFTPDPYRVATSAGGPYAANTLMDSCNGYVPDTSNLLVAFHPGTTGLPLYFSAVSDADTTMIVSTPGGQVLCDDDGGETPFSPLITISNPEEGNYNIWVGVYSQDNAGTDATIYISELHGE